MIARIVSSLIIWWPLLSLAWDSDGLFCLFLRTMRVWLVSSFRLWWSDVSLPWNYDGLTCLFLKTHDGFCCLFLATYELGSNRLSILSTKHNKRPAPVAALGISEHLLDTSKFTGSESQYWAQADGCGVGWVRYVFTTMQWIVIAWLIDRCIAH